MTKALLSNEENKSILDWLSSENGFKSFSRWMRLNSFRFCQINIEDFHNIVAPHDPSLTLSFKIIAWFFKYSFSHSQPLIDEWLKIEKNSQFIFLHIKEENFNTILQSNGIDAIHFKIIFLAIIGNFYERKLSPKSLGEWMAVFRKEEKEIIDTIDELDIISFKGDAKEKRRFFSQAKRISVQRFEMLQAIRQNFDTTTASLEEKENQFKEWLSISDNHQFVEEINILEVGINWSLEVREDYFPCLARVILQYLLNTNSTEEKLKQWLSIDENRQLSTTIDTRVILRNDGIVFSEWFSKVKYLSIFTNIEIFVKAIIQYLSFKKDTQDLISWLMVDRNRLIVDTFINEGIFSKEIISVVSASLEEASRIVEWGESIEKEILSSIQSTKFEKFSQLCHSLEQISQLKKWKRELNTPDKEQDRLDRLLEIATCLNRVCNINMTLQEKEESFLELLKILGNKLGENYISSARIEEELKIAEAAAKIYKITLNYPNIFYMLEGFCEVLVSNPQKIPSIAMLEKLLDVLNERVKYNKLLEKYDILIAGYQKTVDGNICVINKGRQDIAIMLIASPCLLLKVFSHKNISILRRNFPRVYQENRYISILEKACEGMNNRDIEIFANQLAGNLIRGEALSEITIKDAWEQIQDNFTKNISDDGSNIDKFRIYFEVEFSRLLEIDKRQFFDKKKWLSIVKNRLENASKNPGLYPLAYFEKITLLIFSPVESLEENKKSEEIQNELDKIPSNFCLLDTQIAVKNSNYDRALTDIQLNRVVEILRKVPAKNCRFYDEGKFSVDSKAALIENFSSGHCYVVNIALNSFFNAAEIEKQTIKFLKLLMICFESRFFSLFQKNFFLKNIILNFILLNKNQKTIFEREVLLKFFKSFESNESYTVNDFINFLIDSFQDMPNKYFPETPFSSEIWEIFWGVTDENNKNRIFLLWCAFIEKLESEENATNFSFFLIDKINKEQRSILFSLQRTSFLFVKLIKGISKNKKNTSFLLIEKEILEQTFQYYEIFVRNKMLLRCGNFSDKIFLEVNSIENIERDLKVFSRLLVGLFLIVSENEKIFIMDRLNFLGFESKIMKFFYEESFSFLFGLSFNLEERIIRYWEEKNGIPAIAKIFKVSSIEGKKIILSKMKEKEFSESQYVKEFLLNIARNKITVSAEVLEDIFLCFPLRNENWSWVVLNHQNRIFFKNFIKASNFKYGLRFVKKRDDFDFLYMLLKYLEREIFWMFLKEEFDAHSGEFSRIDFIQALLDIQPNEFVKLFFLDGKLDASALQFFSCREINYLIENIDNFSLRKSNAFPEENYLAHQARISPKEIAIMIITAFVEKQAKEKIFRQPLWKFLSESPNLSEFELFTDFTLKLRNFYIRNEINSVAENEINNSTKILTNAYSDIQSAHQLRFLYLKEKNFLMIATSIACYLCLETSLKEDISRQFKSYINLLSDKIENCELSTLLESMTDTIYLALNLGENKSDQIFECLTGNLHFLEKLKNIYEKYYSIEGEESYSIKNYVINILRVLFITRPAELFKRLKQSPAIWYFLVRSLDIKNFLTEETVIEKIRREENRHVFDAKAKVLNASMPGDSQPKVRGWLPLNLNNETMKSLISPEELVFLRNNYAAHRLEYIYRNNSSKEARKARVEMYKNKKGWSNFLERIRCLTGEAPESPYYVASTEHSQTFDKNSDAEFLFNAQVDGAEMLSKSLFNLQETHTATDRIASTPVLQDLNVSLHNWETVPVNYSYSRARTNSCATFFAIKPITGTECLRPMRDNEIERETLVKRRRSCS